MQITRKYLKHRLNIINRFLGRPITGWEKGKNGKPKPNAGHLTLETDSPGDGFTRYRAMELMESGGITYIGHSRAYSNREMEAWLDGFEAGLEFKNKS